MLDNCLLTKQMPICRATATLRATQQSAFAQNKRNSATAYPEVIAAGNGGPDRAKHKSMTIVVSPYAFGERIEKLQIRTE